jgi:hypothetical protein
MPARDPSIDPARPVVLVTVLKIHSDPGELSGRQEKHLQAARFFSVRFAIGACLNE